MTEVIYYFAGYCVGLKKLERIGMDKNSSVYEKLYMLRKMRQCELSAELLHAWIYMQTIVSIFLCGFAFYKLYYYGTLPDSVAIELESLLGKMVAGETLVFVSVAFFIEGITVKRAELKELRQEAYHIKLSIMGKE